MEMVKNEGADSRPSEASGEGKEERGKKEGEGGREEGKAILHARQKCALATSPPLPCAAWERWEGRSDLSLFSAKKTFSIRGAWQRMHDQLSTRPLRHASTASRHHAPPPVLPFPSPSAEDALTIDIGSVVEHGLHAGAVANVPESHAGIPAAADEQEGQLEVPHEAAHGGGMAQQGAPTSARLGVPDAHGSARRERASECYRRGAVSNQHPTPAAIFVSGQGPTMERPRSTWGKVSARGSAGDKEEAPLVLSARKGKPNCSGIEASQAAGAASEAANRGPPQWRGAPALAPRVGPLAGVRRGGGGGCSVGEAAARAAAELKSKWEK